MPKKIIWIVNTNDLTKKQIQRLCEILEVWRKDAEESQTASLQAGMPRQATAMREKAERFAAYRKALHEAL